ncbi:hypothetical protein DY023_10740 [Microbacterium bovistercoris]|uniref:Uncharacterized protein n=1 Tax=Microbacterium bovistercoris TaxID=2293570 RepID=A0A371NSW1_9MICO|nr:hypothetical protein [Microbacterium bovistercoris]REJ05318.1 hypothetical protein DY023_10740 [Microbacterium bovistercoris]
MFEIVDGDPADEPAVDHFGAGAELDPFTSNAFTEEIRNVDEADWTGLDPDLLWGADPADGPDADAAGPDLLA